MFRKDFAWGVATASYQIEGAAAEDGRGPSIWDIYSADGNCYNGQTGDVACDHYHRFREDVALMRRLGVNTYRFSLSWPRILPQGTGAVNKKGIAFYNRLIDCLLENGITPYITLFHWDLPYALELRGSWSNPESPGWFAEYARVAFAAFGDRVKNFITFNEPQCFIGHGYLIGKKAPGVRGTDRDAVVKAHHVMLAHGMAVRLFRQMVPDGRISYAPTCSAAIPATGAKADIDAARDRYFDIDMGNWTWCVSWWSDPVMLGTYPEHTAAFRTLSRYLPAGYQEDLKVISEPIDFYCQNIYTGYRVKAGAGGCEQVPHPVNTQLNALGWAVVPESLYWGPRFLYERYRKPIVISENGMACHDAVSPDGAVHDPNRIDFLRSYLRQLSRAADDGVDLAGYMVWTLTDNFEWTLGYSARLGLVYTDFETQRRIPKDSFCWYQKTIAENGRTLEHQEKRV